MSRTSVLLSAVGLAIALVLLAPAAFAQDPFGPGIAPMGGGQQPKSQPKAPPPGTPEMHAAGGGDSLLPPGSEPGLPKNPLKVGKKLQKRPYSRTKTAVHQAILEGTRVARAI